jgi:hypothetical protein
MIRRRVDKIEVSLTPIEAIAAWIEEVDQFESVGAYSKFVVECGGAPWSALEERVRKGAENRSKAKGNPPSPELVRQCLSEACFYRWLVISMDDQVQELCDRARIVFLAILGILGATSQAVSYKKEIGERFWLLVQQLYGVDLSTAAAFVTAQARHVTGLDEFSTYLRMCMSRNSRAKNKKRAFYRLNAAVQKLCEEHRLYGLSVDLGTTPVTVLRNAPLIDGQWVDKTAIELAEFGRLLRARRMKIEPGEVSYFATVRASAEDTKIAAMRAEVAARLARFPGRTNQIGGRCYLHLDDYRAWPERKAGGSLPITRGVITWAWNHLLRKLSTGAGAKIAGVSLEMLGENPSGGATHRQLDLPLNVKFMKEYLGLPGGLEIAASLISTLLIKTRAMAIASERLSRRHLQGRKILFKTSFTQLESLAEEARSFADIYNEIAETMYKQVPETVADAAVSFEGWRRFRKIDFSKVEKAAQRKASGTVSEVVGTSKAHMLSRFGERDKTLKVYEEVLNNRLARDASAGQVT